MTRRVYRPATALWVRATCCGGPETRRMWQGCPSDVRDGECQATAVGLTALESVYNCFATLSPFAKSTIYLRDTEQADAAGI